MAQGSWCDRPYRSECEYEYEYEYDEDECEYEYDEFHKLQR